jgi:hypothetical protein
MATLREEFRDFVETTAVLLTGGVFDSDTIPQMTNSGGWDWATQNGLVAADGMTLIPHAKIRWRDANPFLGEYRHLRAQRQSAEIYIYDNINYSSVIEPTLIALELALHDTHFYTDDRAGAHCLITHVSGELPAMEYGERPMGFIRATFTQIRK